MRVEGKTSSSGVILRYQLSEDCRRRVFLSDGSLPAKVVSTRIYLRDGISHQFSPDARQLLFELATDFEFQTDPPCIDLGELDSVPTNEDLGVLLLQNKESAIRQVDEAIATERKIAEEYNAKLKAQNELVLRVCEYLESLSEDQLIDLVSFGTLYPPKDAKVISEDFASSPDSSRPLKNLLATCTDNSLKDRFNALEQKTLELKQARKEEESRRLTQERIEWINKHGSDRLKQGAENGYQCEELYVSERAGLEFPGFVVDFDDSAAFRPVDSPSQKALMQLTEFPGARVFKLSESPRYRWTAFNGEQAPLNTILIDEGDLPREALIVEKFLGKYDLIKVVK